MNCLVFFKASPSVRKAALLSPLGVIWKFVVQYFERRCNVILKNGFIFSEVIFEIGFMFFWTMKGCCLTWTSAQETRDFKSKISYVVMLRDHNLVLNMASLGLSLFVSLDMDELEPAQKKRREQLAYLESEEFQKILNAKSKHTDLLKEVWPQSSHDWGLRTRELSGLLIMISARSRHPNICHRHQVLLMSRVRGLWAHRAQCLQVSITATAMVRSSCRCLYLLRLEESVKLSG